MGNSEATTPPKPEKLSSPVQGQPAVHPYPDWAAAMQAYYGSGLVPSPCLSTSVVPGYGSHPYMWAAQPHVPHFGSPYPVMYPNGVYPHPSLPLGTHALYPGPAKSPTATEAAEMATSSAEVPDKTSRSKDKGLITKRTIVNGNSNSLTGAHRNELPESGYSSADGSSNRCGGSNSRGSNNQRNIGSEDLSSSGFTVTPTNIPSPAKVLGVRSSGSAPTPAVPIQMEHGCSGVSSEVRMQDERALKREKRKQSNRESARRSRLRKQAENDELAKKVDSLVDENLNITSEISRLTKISDALRLENSALQDKLKDAQSTQVEESSRGSESTASAVAANLLSTMIDQPRLIGPCEGKHGATCVESSSKLHQILDTNPRTDAVAAS